LLSCLTSLKDANSETVVNEVKQSVDKFIDGNDQFDDLTMLCIKYK
jgi:serine phosphatase RsbU (regulator of sigma subunit)